MDILRVYFNGDDGKFKSLEFATSSWYHKPQIISAIAYQLQHYCNISFLFATSSKYGCQQFPVRQSKSFPVHCLDFGLYKDKLPWIVPEFNDFADTRDYSPTEFFKYTQVLKDTWPDLFVDKMIDYMGLMPVPDGAQLLPVDCDIVSPCDVDEMPF